MSSGVLRIRLILVLSMTAMCWLFLLGRGAWISLFCHAELAAEAHRQQSSDIEIVGQRGTIYDRTGKALVCTIPNPSLAVQLSTATDRQALRELLVQNRICSREKSAELCAADRDGFTWITRRWVPTATIEAMREAMSEAMREAMSDAMRDAMPCLIERTEMKRFYPAAVAAPELLGIAGLDGSGLSGLEYTFDQLLRGTPGKMLQFNTGGGSCANAPPSQILEAPAPGGALVLTIDTRMQEIARHRLQQGMAAVDGIEGSVILLDPWTGEILAMVEAPTFDPLSCESINVEDLRISNVATQFEPGSTFKIVPVAAALEAGVLAPDDTLHCGNGVRIAGRDRIRDHRKFGIATVTEIISGSSNIGAGKIAERVGFTDVNRMAQALGFGHPTGITLPGEAKGYIPHPLSKGWSDRSLITMAYGQEVSCTALQMALAYGAIANGGLLMKPQIVMATLDGKGKVINNSEPEVVRRAMSRETAATVATMLRQVVVDGTGTLAEVPEFPTAGKTGTAQVYDLEARRYDPDEHVLSFVGFAPYEDAKVVCAVSIKCREDLHASDVAVPVFAQILGDLVCYFDELPERSFSVSQELVERISLPDVRGLGADAARRIMHRYGLVPVFENRGDRVAEMLPPARRVVRRGEIITLKLDGGIAVATVAMPTLTGLSLRRAATLLVEADLAFAPSGSGWIIRQDPVAGTEVDRKSLVRVWASPEISRARCDATGRNDIACQTR